MADDKMVGGKDMEYVYSDLIKLSSSDMLHSMMNSYVAQMQAAQDAMFLAAMKSSMLDYASMGCNIDSLAMKPMVKKKEIFSVPKLTAQIGYAIGSCSLGLMLVAATEDGCIQGLHFGDTKEQLMSFLREQFHNFTRVEASIDLSNLIKYVDNPLKYSTMLPLFKLGKFEEAGSTDLQKEALKAMREIPAGQVLSYSELAQKTSKPLAIRAVASACGLNNIAVLVPCHRVIRTDGGVGEYRWGCTRKQLLLRKEGHSG